MSSRKEVLIVGAGLAGLSCAWHLHRNGIPFRVYEASFFPGGRVQSDVQNGFLLDRGFQIFLTAYPEAKRILDYDALKLKPFLPGALVRREGKFETVADPVRQPSKLIETLFASVGTFADKARILALKRSGLASNNGKAPTTREALKEFGFSDEMINDFFSPFFGGIFLENSLDTAPDVFDFVFGMLGSGNNVLPEQGMQAIPQQLVNRLPADSIKLGQPVAKVGEHSIELVSGLTIEGSAVVLATDELLARSLLGRPAPRAFRSQTCLYFSADEAPISEPILVLNGEGRGLVNNFCVPSNVSRTYAPAGKHLMSACVVGNPPLDDNQLKAEVLSQMTDWFGPKVHSWQHLRTYRIEYALPDQSEAAKAERADLKLQQSGVFLCGDYLETGSINGALVSGRKASEAVMQYLQPLKSAVAN